MGVLILYLVCAVASVKGSSLWSLSHLSVEGLNFDVEHDSNNSVRVKAFAQSLAVGSEHRASMIKFFLFTGNSLEGIELQIDDNTTLESSGFDPKTETKVLIHGFANSATSKYSTLMKNAYLKTKKYNILVVDWSALCVPPFYSSAVDNASQVGAAVADLIVWLISRGLSLSHTHLIGHSVGAHIAGVVGRTITGRGLGQVARITGLDLAKPMFEVKAASSRLSSRDADFVDCVHTCGGFLGLSDATCHVDFYPNGGTSPQPGCRFDFLGICSHQRAYKYYIESIAHPEAFRAIRCSAMGSYSPTDCSKESETFMGEYLDVKARGIYYFATASTSPFSLKDSTILISGFKRFSWYFM